MSLFCFDGFFKEKHCLRKNMRSIRKRFVRTRIDSFRSLTWASLAQNEITNLLTRDHHYTGTRFSVYIFSSTNIQEVSCSLNQTVFTFSYWYSIVSCTLREDWFWFYIIYHNLERNNDQEKSIWRKCGGLIRKLLMWKEKKKLKT